MPTPVFTIRNLYCAYTGNKEESVLHIPELDVYKGEILFLLGASGSGKSTLIEVLGLMNNTIAQGEISFYPNGGSNVVELHSLWQSKSTEQLAEVRKSHMSFIFQNTNLMENFTAYENICLSQMIQSGAEQQRAMDSARELMNKVGLPETEVSAATLSVNLSGGQRQRVSFVRALNSGFSVLFGDEPTGNLDEKNANELLGIIRQNISHGATAIIVSHDIELAMRHATRIVCLTKSAGKKISEILPQNIFERSQWENLDAAGENKFRERILSFYQTDVQSVSTGNNELLKHANTHKSFRSLFLSKEGKALAGKNNLNLLIIIALLTFTFLSIGFANGCLNYLDTKLKDPFVKWLTVTIPLERANKGETTDIVRQLNQTDIKAKYNINSVNQYSEEPLFVYNSDKLQHAGGVNAMDTTTTERFTVMARSIYMGDAAEGERDPILKTIMEEENAKPGQGTPGGFIGKSDLSVIVTADMLRDFNYKPGDHVIYIDNEVEDTATGKTMPLKVPLAIRAVVKDIPGKVRMAYTLYFLKSYLSRDLHNCFDLRNQTQIKFVVFSDFATATKAKRAVTAYLESQPYYGFHRPFVSQADTSKDFYQTAFEFNVSFDTVFSYQAYDSIYSKIITSPLLASFKGTDIIRYYDYHNQNNASFGSEIYDAFSINFRDLNMVDSFAAYFKNQFNQQYDKKRGKMLEVDIAKVKQLNNYRFLTNVTRYISILLILFGSLSVGLFVFNIVKQHLSKVKMNIGTFKAFGLPDKDAQFIYFVIILGFIVASIVAALGISFVVGRLINLVVPNIGLEGSEYFKLFDMYTYITILFIIITSLLVSWVTIHRMLNKTPGDLIYNR